MKLDDDQKMLIDAYREFFTNTGGNDIAELIERTDISAFSNIPAAIIQSSCIAQLVMLEKMTQAGQLETSLDFFTKTKG